MFLFKPGSSSPKSAAGTPSIAHHHHLLVLKVNVIILEHTNGYSVKSVTDGNTVCVQA